MSYSNMYQIENLVLGLLESINDKNSDVQESVSESLKILGLSKADFILKFALQFIHKNQLDDSHKTSIINTAEKITKDNIDNLNDKLALEWIEFAANEMIKNKDKEASTAIQNASSLLLVAIGKRFVKEVFDQLQKNFTPGQLPHLFVITTMANLAEANPYGVVPNLSGVLASMLPMLGMAKLDSYKLVFATALCKFSEAILYYCSNIDKAPDKSIQVTNFSTQIYAAHEIFFNIWIKTNDNKLKNIVIESIGHFVNLMTHEKLEADIVKIINGLLALYKKHPDHLVITQSLYLIIKTGVSAQPQLIILDTILDILNKELFAQLVYSLEQQTNKNTNPSALLSIHKNQNEILRCFAELALRYCDRLLPFILQKFEQNNEKMRIASLNVIKHLINSSEEQMSNKKQLVISGLRPLLSETNNKIKKHIIQTIIAMGYHGYLGLESGNLMIEFILKQCSLPDETNDKKQSQNTFDESSNDQLRAQSENILTLFSTTVENMHSILWPHLFEYTCNIEYSRSMNVLCKNLAHIAEQKRNANMDSFIIKYNELINLPRPYEIMTRLIVMCGVPLNNKNRGISVLQLMKQISPNIHSSLIELWENVTPKLLANLEDKISNSKFVNKTWEELLLKFLLNSLDLINDEEIICEIAKAFGKHIETLYQNLSEEKHFAYKCLGVVLNKSTSKNTIDRQLDTIFNNVNHMNQHEREGCAISFGYCASNHLDTVLLKLETYSKTETKKSGGGLFSMISKDTSKSADPDQIKATLALCYGYVTFYAPKDLIISRLEANILRSVSGYASSNIKELVFKQNLLKSVDLITKCMHPDHLQKDFNFSYKTTILNQIIAFISGDNSKVLSNEIKSICFKICLNIVKLNPKLTEADIFQLIKTSTDSFYLLQVPSQGEEKTKDSKASTPKPNDSLNSNEESTDENIILHGNSLYELTAKCLEDLLKTILERDANNNGLTSIYKHLEPWLTSVNDHERLRSIRTLYSVLKHFTNIYKPNEDENKPSSLESFGTILGRIVSRSTDPVIQIRTYTVDCIENLIKINNLMKNDQDKQINDKELESLSTIKQKIVKNDSNILLSAVSDLSKILCKQVTSGEQLIIFIEKLIDGLLDIQSHCSSASCIFLNYCVKIRAGELKSQVDNLIRHLYTKLGLIQNQQAKLGTLRTIRVLFQQHLIESLNVLLSLPIPCNKDMIDICQCLCEDSQLTFEIINHILQIWNRCLPYEEKNNVKYATLTPLIGTCILTELFSNNTTANTEQVFNQNFEKIFSALLVRVSSTLNNQMPFPKSKDEGGTNDIKKDDPKNATKLAVQNEYKKLDPNKISIECFKSFIKCTQTYELFEYYNNQKVWDLLGQESTHIEGYTLLARGLCLHGQNYIKSIVDNLQIFLSAPYDCQKISVTAFYAELINHNCILELVEILMNNLLTKLIDTCNAVRTLCIRGLGNMSSLGKEQVQKHSTTILSAMMAGLDDRDDFNDDITLESMIGLTKIIALIDENNVRPILINILLRIRPCFEKDKAKIRTSAYLLFGELARFGQGPSKDPYLEQIHSNFVNFILHLNEQDQEVKKACKHVLKQVGPLIECNVINDLFQSSLVENKSFHYAEFINNLAKLLVNEFPEKVSFYIMNSVANFKSQWTEIRCNAVLFSGYLLGFLSKEKQSVLSKEHISNALIKLLKEDSAPQVRQKAAEAISLLPDF